MPALAALPAAFRLMASAATLLVASGVARAQTVQFRVIANPSGTFYSRVAPFIQRGNGSYLVENEGDSFSYPPNPGQVYELTPPRRPGEPYGSREIFAFKTDSTGTNPSTAGILDESGALIGTTDLGGVSVGIPTATTGGTVFSLAPPVHRGGPWTETILHRFAGCTVSPCDGFLPADGLVRDASGVYFGFTARGGAHDGGTIFQLVHAQDGTWQETVLYDFPAQPVPYQSYRGPVVDHDGNLVGTGIFGGQYASGFAFKLSRPATTGGLWTYQSLYQFTGLLDGGIPNTELVVAATGALYGTAGGGGRFGSFYTGGVAYELAQDSAGAWSETVLHDFGGPSDASSSLLPFVQGSDGTLYGGSYRGTGTSGGMDLSDGTVFSLKPPAAPGAAWTETILKGFAYCGGGCVDGADPFGALMLSQGKSGSVELTGQTGYGGLRRWGTVFKLTLTLAPAQ